MSCCILYYTEYSVFLISSLDCQTAPCLCYCILYMIQVFEEACYRFSIFLFPFYSHHHYLMGLVLRFIITFAVFTKR